jgi:hypothetical protein
MEGGRLNIQSIKVKDGGVTVKWTQEAANGELAAWACKNAVKPPDGMAEAMQALVPHVLAFQQTQTANPPAFAGLSITRKKATKTQPAREFYKVELDYPKQAMRKAVDSRNLPTEFAHAVCDVIAAAVAYVDSAKKAVVAV